MAPAAPALWSAIGNVVWVVLLGWELAIAHAVAGLLLCVTIVGIPFGVACWKMVPLALLPLGRQVVPVDSVAVRPLPGSPRVARQPGHRPNGQTSRERPLDASARLYVAGPWTGTSRQPRCRG